MSKASLWSLGLIVVYAILWAVADWGVGVALLFCAFWALLVGLTEGRKIGRGDGKPDAPPHRYRADTDKKTPETRSPTGARVHLVPNGPPKTLRGTHVYRYRPALGDVRHNGRGHATET